MANAEGLQGIPTHLEKRLGGRREEQGTGPDAFSHCVLQRGRSAGNKVPFPEGHPKIGLPQPPPSQRRSLPSPASCRATFGGGGPSPGLRLNFSPG